MEASLSELVAQTSLKWIFVGGKGGVGKTTTSCCLGVQLAAVRRNVLIVSTDPAHNLSDAFGQKFGRKPTQVEGFSNLFCMEIDSAAEMEDMTDAAGETGMGAEGVDGGMLGGMSKFVKEMAGAIPGIDEAMSFSELMNRVKYMDFDVTIFDTAPTGHTLRLLALPGMIDGAITKFAGVRDRLGGLFSMARGMMGGGADGPNEDTMFAQLDALKAKVDAVRERLANPDETTFVCVCIPEFLSLYETERLVQELTKLDIDTHNIVVNQVLFVEADSTCPRCLARASMQQKYIDQIGDLYEDFHVAFTPLLNEEVRGAAKLQAFGKFLVTPYTLDTPLPVELGGVPAAAGGHGPSGGAGGKK